MNTCLSCTKFSFQRTPEAWKHSGKGPCDRHEAFTLYDPMEDRECDYFKQASDEVISKRKAWVQECNKLNLSLDRKK